MHVRKARIRDATDRTYIQAQQVTFFFDGNRTIKPVIFASLGVLGKQVVEDRSREMICCIGRLVAGFATPDHG